MSLRAARPSCLFAYLVALQLCCHSAGTGGDQSLAGIGTRCPALVPLPRWLQGSPRDITGDIQPRLMAANPHGVLIPAGLGSPHFPSLFCPLPMVCWAVSLPHKDSRSWQLNTARFDSQGGISKRRPPGRPQLVPPFWQALGFGLPHLQVSRRSELLLTTWRDNMAQACRKIELFSFQCFRTNLF